MQLFRLKERVEKCLRIGLIIFSVFTFGMIFATIVLILVVD